MMTLEEFQATRKWTDDIQKTIGTDLGADGPLPGFTYGHENQVYIIADSGGSSPDLYRLEWMRDEFVSRDLGELERKLHSLASEEGWI